MRSPSTPGRIAVLAALLALLATACHSGAAGPGAAPSTTGTATARGPSSSASATAAWSVASENRLPGTTAWKITQPAKGDEIDGFAARTSVRAGQPVPLYVSTTARTWSVSAYRMGWYAGKGGRRVSAAAANQPAVHQPAATVDPTTRTVIAPWTHPLSVPTAGWPPGDYLLKLTAASGGQRYVPLVVRSPRTAGTVVIDNAALTWQAYNAWGGYSLYHGHHGFGDRAYAVSFDRPYDANGADKFMVYERPLVAEAERLGLPLSYVTDIDVSTDPGLLSGARAVLSLGHDEYWTAQDRSAFQAAAAGGANLTFFGANEAYWQVRLAATRLGADRLVVEYKSAALDPMHRSHPQQATERFRDLPDPEPEAELSGLDYECYPALGHYKIEDPSFWGFAGTGVKRGRVIPGLVGVEIDRAYPLPSTPRPVDVVAHSPVRCRGTSTYSDSAYSTRKSGAGVFATGTMHWTCVLAGSCRQFGATDASTSFVRRVTDNVLREFARGPAGKAQPARDNLDALHESPVNTTGAA